MCYLSKVKKQIYHPNISETLCWTSEKALFVSIVTSLTFTYHGLVEGISPITVRSPFNIEIEILYTISILNTRIRNPEPAKQT